MSRLLNEHQLASEPFHVTEELLPALLGKLVKLVQETEIKTDRDMDNTINKAATEVMQEATNTKSEVEDNSNEKDFEISGKMLKNGEYEAEKRKAKKHYFRLGNSFRSGTLADLAKQKNWYKNRFTVVVQLSNFTKLLHQ